MNKSKSKSKHKLSLKDYATLFSLLVFEVILVIILIDIMDYMKTVEERNFISIRDHVEPNVLIKTTICEMVKPEYLIKPEEC